jgi:hypothetical protein
MSEGNYMVARKHGLIGMSERAAKAIHRSGVGDMTTFYINWKEVDSAPNDPDRRVQPLRDQEAGEEKLAFVGVQARVG